MKFSSSCWGGAQGRWKAALLELHPSETGEILLSSVRAVIRGCELFKDHDSDATFKKEIDCAAKGLVKNGTVVHDSDRVSVWEGAEHGKLHQLHRTHGSNSNFVYLTGLHGSKLSNTYLHNMSIIHVA